MQLQAKAEKARQQAELSERETQKAEKARAAAEASLKEAKSRVEKERAQGEADKASKEAAEAAAKASESINTVRDCDRAQEVITKVGDVNKDVNNDFDYNGVAQYLKTDFLVTVFREVMLGASGKKFIPVNKHAELAKLIFDKAEEENRKGTHTGHALTG